ncbi:MAG: SDR family oxidoreductase [Kofleriaceae bacterium]|nr:MAG: SDR family oxidoreductase [Kofleriaceae bacterium]MBZ0231268.1 SDR family oxidoreductase [Kofleriaceae bacterium]
MKRFEGKVALVTGAASGIGKATVERLTEEGATVVALDIADGPGRVDVKCDISDEQQVNDAIAAVIAKHDRLDVLCNVAGILRADHTHELKLESWEKIIRVNLTGTFLVCKAAIPHLLKTKGCIVNTSSTSALGSHPWMAAYAASKGGILSMTRVIAVEYAKQGLRANCVCPGGINTPLHGQFRMPKGVDLELLRGAMPPVPQVGPEYAASVIAFLASDDAKYMNGAEVRADGGALS